MIKKIAVGVIIFCVLVIVVISVATCEPTPSSTPADEPQTTQPAEPETQTGAITIQEQNYITSVSEISMTMGNTLTEFGSLLQNPQIGNDEWTLDVAAQLVIIRFEYEKTVKLIPPDSLAVVHNKFNLGMVYLNEMTYIFAEGVDNMDTDLIEEATNKMNEGTGYILEAVDLMNEFNAAHEL